MKLKIIFGLILALAVGAVIVSERRAVKAEVSPAPILYFVADTEHELTRVPVSLTRISDAEEIKAGDQMAQAFLDSLNKRDDPEVRIISAYVRQVGAKLAVHAHRNLPYKFHYLPDDDLVNAFALPGGHIFIGKGLLNLMDTEDELANVLGHEVEHVEMGHCAERVQIEVRLKKLPLGEVAAIPIELFQTGYSKEQELQADREGTKLAVASGFSAEGAISMFQRFQKLQEQYQQYASRGRSQPQVVELPGDIANTVVLQTLEEYFRSHPPAEERIAQVQRLIAAEHWPDQKQQPLQVAYLLRADEAATLFSQGEFDKASKKANESLALHADYYPALNVLGNVAFEKADFAGAAPQYRKSLNLNPKQDAIARQYALSLSASLAPQQAAAEYTSWIESVPPEVRASDSITVEQVGLKLMAGDTDAAKSVAAYLASNEKDDTPLLQGRLGWWYFRAGDLDTAAALLSSAVEQRAQISWLNTAMGWVLESQKKYESAQQRFYAPTADPDRWTQAESLMGLAVTEWQARQPEIALGHYRNAIVERPAWTNPQWTSALYGSNVTSVIQSIKRVNDARKKAASAMH